MLAMTTRAVFLCALFVFSTARAEPPTSADELRLERLPRPTLSIRVQRTGRAVRMDREVSIVKGEQVRLSLARQGEGQPHWFLILPDVSRNYSNAGRPDEADAYRWHGLQAISYWQVELEDLRGRWEIEPFAGASVADAVKRLGEALVAGGAAPQNLRYFRSDVGTFWFAASVEFSRGTTRTPGATETDARGLSPLVLRLSVRESNGYLGALSAFYNVPGVFGSTTYQAIHHLGADCADVLLAALAEWTGQPPGKNTNVQSLTEKLQHVAELDIVDGVPNQKLRWGAEIQPGDFIAVRYEGSRKYGHIGALHSDTDGDGVLSAKDLTLHNGPDALHDTALEEGAFDGHVLILRPAPLSTK
jgi:hypothetical protein